jgi:hypothetical protein
LAEVERGKGVAERVEAEEADRRALLQLAAVAIGLALALDPLRLLVGAGVTLSLSPGTAEDADVANGPARPVRPSRPRA